MSCLFYFVLFIFNNLQWLLKKIYMNKQSCSLLCFGYAWLTICNVCIGRISAKTVSMYETFQLWTNCGKYFQKVQRLGYAKFLYYQTH